MLLNPPLPDTADLRQYAISQVVELPLIQRCGAGDPIAIKALLCGFWPFVLDFQSIVRNDTFFPMNPIISRFGRAAVVQAIRHIKQSLHHMAEEEGMHAEIWRKGAQEAGFTDYDLQFYRLPAVEALINFTSNNTPSSPEPHLFFCHLAATEYVAEEISRFLVQQQAFVSRFRQSGRWQWGDIHLLDHAHGPSHREIDEDLAQAFCSHPDPADAVMNGIRHCIELFSIAGRESLDVFESEMLSMA